MALSPAHNHPLLNTSENQSGTGCATATRRHRDGVPLRAAPGELGPAGAGVSSRARCRMRADLAHPSGSPLPPGCGFLVENTKAGFGRGTRGQSCFVTAPSLGQARRETRPARRCPAFLPPPSSSPGSLCCLGHDPGQGAHEEDSQWMRSTSHLIKFFLF